MTEILTESFCERCGTRYTFESAKPRARLKGVKVLSRGLKNFVLSDTTSMDEAMATARSDTDREVTAHQLDAFHKTFNFCMSCRQYTCPNCWNDAEARCLTCAPHLGKEVMPAPFPDLVSPSFLVPRTTDAIALDGAGSTNGSANGSTTRAPDPWAPQPEAPAAPSPIDPVWGELDSLAPDEPVFAVDPHFDAEAIVAGDFLIGDTEPILPNDQVAQVAAPEPEVELELTTTSVAPESVAEAEAFADAGSVAEDEAAVEAEPEPLAAEAIGAAAIIAGPGAELVAEPFAEPDPIAAEAVVDEPELVAEAEPAEPEPIAAAAEPEPISTALPEAWIVKDAIDEGGADALATSPVPVDEGVGAPAAETDLDEVAATAAPEVDEDAQIAARLAAMAAGAFVVGEAKSDDPALRAAIGEKTSAQTGGLLRRFRAGQSLDAELDAYERLRAEASDEPAAPETGLEPETQVVSADPAPEIRPEIAAVVAAEAAIVAPEPEITAPEPQAAAPEPEITAAPTPEPKSRREIAAVVAAAAAIVTPEPEIEITAARGAEIVAEPVSEPAAATASEPPPVAAEPETRAAPARPPAAPLPVDDIVPQPTWQMVAPDPSTESPVAPTGPQPSIPAAAVASNGEPQWPTRPDWLGGEPATGLPFLGRPATPQGGLEALWAESTREVIATPGKAATAGVQPCVSCGLSLSATARFCRRCGTPQAS